MTSALDMPEIMSYIYSKSWKLQFSASSSIIIIEDYYLQTFLHSLAKRLRKEGYIGPIIFLTAFREYVFHGYEVHALNYLLKPVKEEPLFLCPNEIANDISKSSYLYRNKQDIISIPYKEIITFSSSLHYIDILTVSDHYCQYATLNNIIEYLPQEFIRIHKSCIVNMAHIYKVTGSTIVLSNHMTTQIGRSYMKSVIAAFTAYSMRFDKA